MFRNVMVGIDEETLGRDAITLAQHLVDPAGELTFVHVAPSSPLLGRAASLTMNEDAVAVLEAAVDESGLDPQLRVVTGVAPGAGLHRVAEETGADLLVVGSTTHGRLGRVLLGDTTSQALDGSVCAVAIAPHGYADRSVEMAEIGVAFNGSLESLNALALARDLAADTGAQVAAFEAVELPPYSAPAGTWGTYDEVTHEGLAEARRRVADLGEDIEAHVACGEPVRQLAIFSDSVDLLVAGSRGYGPLGRLVHGSTTRRLARVARCPLLIVTRLDRQQRGEPAELSRRDHQILAQ